MPAIDSYPPSSYAKSGFGPFSVAEAVTPNDGVDLVNVSCALTCVVSGTCTVITVGGVTVQVVLTAGQILPIRAARVKATGTLATGITAWS